MTLDEIMKEVFTVLSVLSGIFIILGIIAVVPWLAGIGFTMFSIALAIAVLGMFNFYTWLEE
jgi:hypothetical protein